MAESDSPLSMTFSVISILTLVYALTITLQIYATALYQFERETEALAQYLRRSDHGINEMRMTLVRYAAANGHYDIDSLENPHGERRVWEFKSNQKTGRLLLKTCISWLRRSKLQKRHGQIVWTTGSPSRTT
jgi:hypothetical protein